MKKTLPVTLLLVAGILLLSGCSAGNSGVSTQATTEKSAAYTSAPDTGTGGGEYTVSDQSTEDPQFCYSTWSVAASMSVSTGGGYLSGSSSEIFRDEPSYVNYLTGELLSDDDTTLGVCRPTGVSIVNTSDAVSLQRGLSEADVLWEVQAGSQATRLMAFYYNPSSISAIGPVAALTPGQVSIGEGYDAYLLYNGVVSGTYSILIEQQSDGVNAASETGTSCFFTDSDVSAEQGYNLSVYTSSGRIAKSIITLASQGAHSIIDDRYLVPFSFAQKTLNIIGGSASRVHLDYGGFQPYFLYDTSTGLYRRFEHGAPQTDSDTGAVLSFKNVIVLVSAGSEEEGWELSGSGIGIYASGGKYQSITWAKNSTESPVRFYNASGAELTVNQGHTFISVVSSSDALTVS